MEQIGLINYYRRLDTATVARWEATHVGKHLNTTPLHWLVVTFIGTTPFFQFSPK
jgi:hypothetical protein